jgi:ribosomal protein L7Ae-like RNA K-turn-binding protein
VTADDFCHMIRLIEISPVDQLADPQALRAHLSTLDDPRVKILPQAAEAPWVIAHTRDLDAEALLALLPANQGFAVTQLRCRIDLGAPSGQSLRSLIENARHQHALVLGRAAVERAAQRRRLDLVVIAGDVDPGYADSLERILLGCAPSVQVIVAAVTARELGTLTGTKRTGVAGFTRGHATVRLC